MIDMAREIDRLRAENRELRATVNTLVRERDRARVEKATLARQLAGSVPTRARWLAFDDGRLVAARGGGS